MSKVTGLQGFALLCIPWMTLSIYQCFFFWQWLNRTCFCPGGAGQVDLPCQRAGNAAGVKTRQTGCVYVCMCAEGSLQVYVLIW